MIRNILAVLAGLTVSILLIMLAVTADKHWFDELSTVDINIKADVFVYWQSVINQAPQEFFIALAIAFSVSSFVGGIIAAIIAEKAKTAYAIFIGFMLFLLAFLDVIVHLHHPTWYEISIWFVFFPFAWLGGKLVEEVQKRT